MFDVRIEGADQLERVGKALKKAGAGDLRKELLRGIREAGKPAVEKVKAEVPDRIPSGGGLAAKVAGSKFAVRNRLAGRGAGVRIVATNAMQLEGLDRGRLRHPVHGNRKVWVSQVVPAGWFSDPLSFSADTFRTGIEKVMADVARKIEGAA